MKKQILISFACFLAASIAMPANKISNDESGVVAEVLTREIVVKRLLPKQDSNIYQYMKWSIDGSGKATTHVDITDFHCERSSGIDTCDISFFGLLNNGEGGEPEFSFKIRAKVYRGTVKSATVEDFAG